MSAAKTSATTTNPGSFAAAAVKDVAFHVVFAPDSLGIPDLRAKVADQPVRASLEVTRFADPRVAFSLAGDLDLAAIAPLISWRRLTMANVRRNVALPRLFGVVGQRRHGQRPRGRGGVDRAGVSAARGSISQSKR